MMDGLGLEADTGGRRPSILYERTSMIRFTNTLTRRLEEFVPLKPGRVNLYSCGPTVYDYAHIGNFRTFVWVDFLVRFLQWEGLSVKHVMNLTDIDDKTIRRSNEEGVPLRELTDRFARAFFEDLETLHILPADIYPRATEHVEQMQDLLKSLESRGLTYLSGDSLYYRIRGFLPYGLLSHLDKDGMKDGARVESDEYDKESPRDFVLWKGSKPGEPSWNSPWGDGRPGWHLECSAMSTHYLGDTFDIHTGGADLVFPHHENEIAQSQGATGKPPVRYWLHAAFLLINGEKMSKSKGNYYTLRDLLERGEDPDAVRYLLLSVPYRKQLNFTLDGLEAAGSALQRIRDFTARFKDSPRSASANGELRSAIQAHRTAFRAALEDDLNSANALGELFEAIRTANVALDAGGLSQGAAQEMEILLSDFEAVFGLETSPRVLLDADIEALIEKRQQARREKNFAEADRIRDELKGKGIILEDTPQGVRWKRA
ncbi:MAG: cysteine--tRNA ligase [Acidobacteriota bacterium]|jgi:cysteinyl-tRNA synthetase